MNVLASIYLRCHLRQRGPAPTVVPFIKPTYRYHWIYHGCRYGLFILDFDILLYGYNEGDWTTVTSCIVWLTG